MIFLEKGTRDNRSPILLLHSYTRYLDQVQAYYTDCLHFLQLTLQTAIFGFHNIDNGTFFIKNHILLLLKIRIYNAKKRGFLSFINFLNEISKIKNLERRVTVNNWNKFERFRKKQHIVGNKVLTQDLVGNKKKKNFLWIQRRRKGGAKIQVALLRLSFFYSFCFIKYVYIYVHVCTYIYIYIIYIKYIINITYNIYYINI